MEHTHLEPARNRIDALTDTVLAFLAHQDRGFCQETESENCFRLAEISDTRTSLSYCLTHWFERIGRKNREVMRRAEREL